MNGSYEEHLKATGPVPRRSRPSKHEYYLGIAKEVAKRSQDIDTQVGMILVNPKTGAIISTGYNGFVRGADDKHLPSTRPEKYTYMVHAEPNLIYNCARHGISTEGCIVYGTLSPCAPCVRTLWQSGISCVVFSNIHPSFEDTKVMKDLAVEVTECGEREKYYVAQLSPRSLTLVKGAG